MFSVFVCLYRAWCAAERLEGKSPQKSYRLHYFPLAAIERGPRRFRNTRGRRRRPKGACTAADGVRAGAGARRAQISGVGKGLTALTYAPVSSGNRSNPADDRAVPRGEP